MGLSTGRFRLPVLWVIWRLNIILSRVSDTDVSGSKQVQPASSSDRKLRILSKYASAQPSNGQSSTPPAAQAQEARRPGCHRAQSPGEPEAASSNAQGGGLAFGGNPPRAASHSHLARARCPGESGRRSRSHGRSASPTRRSHSTGGQNRSPAP